MKQREFVVVVLRLFAIWLGVQSLINFVQEVSTPSIRDQPIMTLVLIAFALLMTLGISLLLWIKSEPLMRRAYAGSETWETEPIEYEDEAVDGPILEGSEFVETPAVGQFASASTEQFEYVEHVSSFSQGITVRDIFLVFMIALGVWLLVTTIPVFVLFLIKYLQLSSEMKGDSASRILVQQLVYYGLQIAIGAVLLRPRKIVDRLWKEGGVEVETVSN